MVALKFLVGAIVWEAGKVHSSREVLKSFNIITDKCLSEAMLGQARELF